MNVKSKFILVLIIFFSGQFVFAQKKNISSALEKDFFNPPESAKPWVFWYWLHGAISK